MTANEIAFGGNRFQQHLILCKILGIVVSECDSFSFFLPLNKQILNNTARIFLYPTVFEFPANKSSRVFYNLKPVPTIPLALHTHV